MKNSTILCIMLAGLFMTSQLLAQVDAKTNEKKPASEQKQDPNATKTAKDQKTQIGGYTKSGTTVTAPAETKPGTVTQPGPDVNSIKPGIIYDRTGGIMAKVEEDGTIKDAKGKTIARYSGNGDYFGPSGDKIGTVKDGVIRNKEGKEAGRIGKDGKVTNAKGKLLGTIYDDGSIRNSKGSKLGSAPGVNKNISAMIFFNNKKGSSGEKKSKTQAQPEFQTKPKDKK